MNLTFDPVGSRFTYGNISLGDNVFIASGAWFSSDRAKIKIGSEVMFGPGVKILGGDHEFKNTEMPMFFAKKNPGKKQADINISNDVWIGANAVILEGVQIGTGSIVGAGSLVAKDVESYSIYAGVPARKIKDRFTAVELAEYKRNLERAGL
ncbi:acyltransferase [Halopseudomonas laoshanensis]|uniref:acyltransferase n=1 Tax=Halopseudomonas laoshanensis TaxID=2268758 RepID=UPI00373525A3